MNLKESVNHQAVRREIWYALGVVDVIYRFNNLKLVVTSLTDGKHKPNSLHYSGLAVDLRTRDIPTDLLRSVHRSIHDFLNPLGYDVVLEPDHIHLEFDPKPGENWITFVG